MITVINDGVTRVGLTIVRHICMKDLERDRVRKLGVSLSSFYYLLLHCIYDVAIALNHIHIPPHSPSSVDLSYL